MPLTATLLEVDDTELRLKNGKYTARAGGGVETVQGAEELAQRVEMKLTARRGGFALAPEFGSRLYMLPGMHVSQREAAARQYIAEALADEDGLALELLEMRGEADMLELHLEFSYAGGGFELELRS